MLSRSATPVIAAGLLAAGCVIVPVQTEAYDPACRLVTHHIELQPVVLGQLNSCSGQGCEALVLASLGVTAVSAVVSGSIAIIGNVAAGCAAPPPQAPPPLT
ncbi:MAG: hypothetical protein JF585_13285 [Burkholderiales bacterium]|nr:hypothetical protein [Burkholderiales bacterium]